MKSLKQLLALAVSAGLLFSGVAFAGSAYDSASGISGSSHRAAEEAAQTGSFD